MWRCCETRWHTWCVPGSLSTDRAQPPSRTLVRPTPLFPLSRTQATLPHCDMVVQAEMAALGLLDDLLPAPLLAPARHLAGYAPGGQLLFNLGVVALRPTPAAAALAAEMLTAFAALARDGRRPDDQAVFQALIASRYELQGVPACDGGGDDAETRACVRRRNAHLRDEANAGRCATYRRRRRDSDGNRDGGSAGGEPASSGGNSEVLRVWLLHPALFPLRPTAERSTATAAMLEPPYLVHYNWEVGIARKRAAMVAAGHWWLDDIADTVVGEQLG